LRAWRCGRLKHSRAACGRHTFGTPAPPSSFVNTSNRLALQHYLDECVFRFNRRHTRHAAFDTLLGIGASTNPAPHVVLIHKTAEPGQTTSRDAGPSCISDIPELLTSNYCKYKSVRGLSALDI
jgi:hypothetical protein